MMSQYKIITDSACDLPKAMLQQLDVSAVPPHVLFRGENLEDSVDEGIKEIYDGLRAGEKTSTTAVNPEGWANAIEPVVAAGRDVLVLAFSSGLSTTYQSAVIAAGELEEKYPDRKILVCDTLCASMGQGLLVWYACRKRDEGATLEEVYNWVEENKLHLEDVSGKKKKILVCFIQAHIGGAMTSLVNFLNSLDTTKYDVDVMFYENKTFMQNLSKWQLPSDCISDNMFGRIKGFPKRFKPKGVQ